MAQEYQTCDSGGDGSLGFSIIGCSGKFSNRKSKQRRAPQRGLGVAQLEKIRLEEQQKRNANAVFSPPSALSPPKTFSKLSVLAPNLHPIKQSSSSVPVSPSPTSFSPSNFVFKSPLPSHNIDDTNIRTPVVQLENGGFETEWSDLPILGQGEVPKPCNPLEFIPQQDNLVFNSKLGFRSNFVLTHESNIDWSSPGLVQKEQQHQLSSSAGVDVSSSLSLLNFLTEPPSNQNYRGNHTAVSDQMFGTKRPYAFFVDSSAGPSFNCRPPMAAPMRSDESASCSNVGLYSFPFLEEGSSCSSSSSEPNSRKKMKGNVFRGDLPTLATPTTTWMCQNSKIKHPSGHATDSNNEFTDLVSLPLRGIMEFPTCPHPAPSWPYQFQPYYRFLPPALAQNGQTSPRTSSILNVEDESVDLNLKL
ncbi:uncharacterized protein LOC101210166 [Cucumis sativus]|uniref:SPOROCYTELESS-like EAR-containing protein 4 n=1 Tax=Cucumis sativus TaxID=3659 RepID=A0A0A0L0E8_CUCSA|nr:uncharacterized protein LOC101210166 [Cucumis sativus]KGN53601.1 hypothetical protein Csa_015413 [Cucumis sativus]QBL95717.1 SPOROCYTELESS-like EAR-containing protein 4 [Cucumis sativus]